MEGVIFSHGETKVTLRPHVVAQVRFRVSVELKGIKSNKRNFTVHRVGMMGGN